MVYAPSYKRREHWVTRRLTTLEQLRLRQIPLLMDPQLSGLSSGGTFPFEDSLSPEVFTSIFRQLWGTVVGCCDSNEAVEEKAVEEKYVEDDSTEEEILEEEVEDDSKEEILEQEVEEEDHCGHSCGGDDSMTAFVKRSSGPNISSSPIEVSEWEQDLDYRFGHEDGSVLTDEDTVTSDLRQHCAEEEQDGMMVVKSTNLDLARRRTLARRSRWVMSFFVTYQVNCGG